MTRGPLPGGKEVGPADPRAASVYTRCTSTFHGNTREGCGRKLPGETGCGMWDEVEEEGGGLTVADQQLRLGGTHVVSEQLSQE